MGTGKQTGGPVGRDSAHSIVYARLEVMKLPTRIHLSPLFGRRNATARRRLARPFGARSGASCSRRGRSRCGARGFRRKARKGARAPGRERRRVRPCPGKRPECRRQEARRGAGRRETPAQAEATTPSSPPRSRPRPPLGSDSRCRNLLCALPRPSKAFFSARQLYQTDAVNAYRFRLKIRIRASPTAWHPRPLAGFAPKRRKNTPSPARNFALHFYCSYTSIVLCIPL